MKLAPEARNFCPRCPLLLILWAVLLGSCQKDNLQGPLRIKYEIRVNSDFVPQFGGYGLSLTYTSGTEQTQNLIVTPTGNTWSKEYILDTEQRPVLIKFYGAGTTAGTFGKAILNLYINDKIRNSTEYPILNSGAGYGRFNAYPGTSYNIR